jgi:plastocyanin
MSPPVASTRSRRLAAVIGALSVSLTMAACGGGGGDEESPPANSSPDAASGTKTINMVDLEFEPKELTVPKGTTVTFVNKGEVTHNAKGKDFFSRVVEPGDSYEHKFTKAGSFDYVCTFHPGMVGTLTVE